MYTKAKMKLAKMADFWNQHWVLKTIILFFPSVYLPVIVKYFGKHLGLTTTRQEGIVLTTLGLIITIVIYIVVLLLNILGNYKAKRDKIREADVATQQETLIQEYENKLQYYSNTLKVHTRLSDVIGKICDNKLDSICSYIESCMQNNEFRKPFNETAYPEKQLKCIAQEIKSCLAEITAPPLNNISVSIAYQLPTISKVWRWIDQNEIQQCLPLSKLQKNQKTTFHMVYSGSKDFVFFNDKKQAELKGKYVFDKKDERHGNTGSIVCDSITLANDSGTIARIILTISTYGYKFTNSVDETILENMSKIIEEVILQQFEKRIRIEMALLFIKKKYNNKNASKITGKPLYNLN